MRKRTLTGAVITLAVYLVVAYSHIPAVLLGSTAALSLAAVFEIYSAAGISRNRGLLWASLAAAAILSVLPAANDGPWLAGIFLLAAGVFAWMMIRQHSFKGLKTWQTCIVAFLAVMLFRAIPVLRKEPHGLLYLAAAITLCFVTDVVAYLVGSRFGRRKLIPSVSPNKTVEGAAAGIAASVLVMCLAGFLLERFQGVDVNFLLMCIYGVTASVVGQFGDLSMSVVKRICGVKDFGHLLPGHGGILDRFDSHLFCIAFTLLFCRLTGGFLG